MRLRLPMACGAAALVLVGAAVARTDPSPPPVRGSSQVVVVAAAPGASEAAARAVERLGGEVLVRRGRLLQVRVPSAAAAPLGAQESVRGLGPAASGYADAVTSQGVYRAGADALVTRGLSGAGVRVAVVDLGFGETWPARVGNELPPAARIDDTVSFDRTSGQPGIVGLSASMTPTSHGESVAEVVHDMAPGASLTLVNYHTELEFAEAVDWLIAGPGGRPRVDVVVHSNSFLTGPFDGTSPTARAVDRARAAGLLWVNSAGNYGLRHWQGAVGDADRDGWADVGRNRRSVRFAASPGTPMGALLSWSGCVRGLVPVDPQSVQLEVYITSLDDASPIVLAESGRDASRPLSSLAWTTPSAATYAIRVRQKDSSVRCALELFVPGVTLSESEAVAASSVPTPGDARGALAVGAADWRDDSLADYSSQGPTDDGRLKPDLSAPASTNVWPGIAMVGTSASAPHVAGAAALLIERARLDGRPADPAAITAELKSTALDLGAPGTDQTFGAGRLRLDSTAPVLEATSPAPGAVVSGPVRLRARAFDDGTLDAWGVSVDGVPQLVPPGAPQVRWDAALAGDGPHVASFWARDMAGNRSDVAVSFTADSTPPSLGWAPESRGQAAGGSGTRPVTLSILDLTSPRGEVEVTVRDARGAVVLQRLAPVRFRAGEARLRVALPVGAERPLHVRAVAVDEAGNASAPIALVERGPSAR